MTKAFLETMVLKPENEKFILKAFSEENKKKIKNLNAKISKNTRKRSARKLSLEDIALLK